MDSIKGLMLKTKAAWDLSSISECLKRVDLHWLVTQGGFRTSNLTVTEDLQFVSLRNKVEKKHNKKLSQKLNARCVWGRKNSWRKQLGSHTDRFQTESSHNGAEFQLKWNQNPDRIKLEFNRNPVEQDHSSSARNQPGGRCGRRITVDYLSKLRRCIKRWKVIVEGFASNCVHEG